MKKNKNKNINITVFPNDPVVKLINNGHWNPDNSPNWVKDAKKVEINKESKLGRNDPCSCGSGKKFKHCCLN